MPYKLKSCSNFSQENIQKLQHNYNTSQLKAILQLCSLFTVSHSLNEDFNANISPALDKLSHSIKDLLVLQPMQIARLLQQGINDSNAEAVFAETVRNTPNDNANINSGSSSSSTSRNYLLVLLCLVVIIPRVNLPLPLALYPARREVYLFRIAVSVINNGVRSGQKTLKGTYTYQSQIQIIIA